MATEDHLTIRDYFDHALFGGSARREAVPAIDSDAAGPGSFHRILTAYGCQLRKQDNLKPTGLTVVDYLKNPVRVKCQFNHRFTSKAPEKTEATANNPNAPQAPISGGQATDTSAATSLLKNTPQPQVGTDSSAPASPGNQTSSDESLMIERSILKAARRYNLPPGLIRGVIRAESNFQVDAISRTGAQGLMQLMPATARELGIADPFDIEQNIEGGTRYLRQMLDSFGGDVKVALAAYNAGPGTVEKYGGQIPPYQETEHYINRVLKFSKQMV